MKILSIGNSFSKDAHQYLHRLAGANGDLLQCVNLYIGGCSLQAHYLNMLDDKENYDLFFNGEDTGIKVSIRQALASTDYDVVTLQQASRFSGKTETYFPYIKSLSEYVKTYCPHTKIYIHQTWAYEDGSEALKSIGYDTAQEMFENLRNSYENVAQTINADDIIPCGQAMFNATEMGIEKIHGDTVHASWDVGCYLLALTWYKALTGKDITDNNFDVPVEKEKREIIIRAVNKSFEIKSR